MATDRKLRLSPSGPFIRDVVSGAPLEVGPGSLGIVLRAQGNTGVADVLSAVSATQITGLDLEGAVNLPPGYHYDFSSGFTIEGTTGEIAVVYEYTDDGVTWTNVARQTTQLVCPEGSYLTAREINVDRTAAVAAITGIRLRIQAVTGTLSCQAGNSWVRVEQYVL